MNTEGAKGDHLLAVRKAVRFIRIYGLSRTFAKVMGRLRIPTIGGLRPRGHVGIAFVGCGQFAFATIAYFLQRKVGSCITACYDSDRSAAQSFARFYRIPRIADSFFELLSESDFSILYVASNHASHTDYAVQGLRNGKSVYVEKPVSVSREQLHQLSKAYRETDGGLFAGYNRPLSKAVRDLSDFCADILSPLTLSCFVSGHCLPEDHWYRDSREGTRICGNVGHWLDLAVHLLSWGELPDRWWITLAWSDGRARDDDLAICLTSERGDLISIVLTARTEPFEGINETINLQWGTTIAKIDDFRRMTVWKGARRRRFRYWPKDVGHRNAILQPFMQARRNWHEVELSSLLMLRISEMVVNGERTSEFSFDTEWASLMPRMPERSRHETNNAES